MSVALANDSTKGLATWKGLLQTLLSGTENRLKTHLTSGTLEGRWLKRTSLDHRMHIIHTLSQGDTDMTVAMMYLIDRIHKQLIHECHNCRYSWQEDLNAAMGLIEKDIDAGSPWRSILKRMGDLAKRGAAMIITTNFDHAVARLAGLPVYVGPRPRGSAINAAGKDYAAAPAGLVIPADEVEKAAMMSADTFNSLLHGHLPPPAAYWQTWDSPSSVPVRWFPELASVLHIHGSRRVPHSLVFDPSSYDSIAEEKDGMNLLVKLLATPNSSGAVIFVGCGGTLLDPHFIKYWQKRNLTSFIATLADEYAADDLLRRFGVFEFKQAPKVVSYGQKFTELPGQLEKLLGALESA